MDCVEERSVTDFEGDKGRIKIVGTVHERLISQAYYEARQALYCSKLDVFAFHFNRYLFFLSDVTFRRGLIRHIATHHDLFSHIQHVINSHDLPLVPQTSKLLVR